MSIYKHLPPYGRLLKRYPPKNNGVQLYIGQSAWQSARVSNGTIEYMQKYGAGNLVLPKDENPHNFDWRICTAMEIAIISEEDGRDPKLLDDLAKLLIQSGAAKVVILDIHNGISPTYLPKEATA